MVGVLPRALAHVQVDVRRRRERLPEVPGHLGVERRIAEREHLAERKMPDEERTARQVERDLDQRLVEREQPAPEAGDARLVPHRLHEGLAERDADVLHGVVTVDVEVARRENLEAESTVARELAEHVVEEREASAHLGCARPVEVEVDQDGGLLRLPLLGADPLTHWTISSRAASSASSSAEVPIVTRRQPSRRGHDAKFLTSTERSSSRCHKRSPSIVVGRISTKLAPDGHTSIGSSLSLAIRRPRSST